MVQIRWAANYNAEEDAMWHLYQEPVHAAHTADLLVLHSPISAHRKQLYQQCIMSGQEKNDVERK